MKKYRIISYSYAGDVESCADGIARGVKEAAEKYETFELVGGVSFSRQQRVISNQDSELVFAMQAFTVDLEEYNKVNGG